MTRLMATKFFGLLWPSNVWENLLYVYHLTTHLTHFFNGQGCATNSSLIRQIRDRSYWYGNLQQQSGGETHSQTYTIIISIKPQISTFQKDAAMHNN